MSERSSSETTEKSEETYKCGLCNTYFLSKKTLKQHYKRTHRDTKSGEEHVQESSRTEGSKREEMLEDTPITKAQDNNASFKEKRSLITETGMIGSWCVISMHGREIKARIKHVGHGRFKILEDNVEGKYVGKIIDASEVTHCRVK